MSTKFRPNPPSGCRAMAKNAAWGASFYSPKVAVCKSNSWCLCEKDDSIQYCRAVASLFYMIGIVWPLPKSTVRRPRESCTDPPTLRLCILTSLWRLGFVRFYRGYIKHFKGLLRSLKPFNESMFLFLGCANGGRTPRQCAEEVQHAQAAHTIAQQLQPQCQAIPESIMLHFLVPPENSCGKSYMKNREIKGGGYMISQILYPPVYLLICVWDFLQEMSPHPPGSLPVARRFPYKHLILGMLVGSEWMFVIAFKRQGKGMEGPSRSFDGLPRQY